MSNDQQLIQLWLTSSCRSKHTRRAYEADVESFMAHVAKPLGLVTLADAQAGFVTHEPATF